MKIKKASKEGITYNVVLKPQGVALIQHCNVTVDVVYSHVIDGVPQELTLNDFTTRGYTV